MNVPSALVSLTDILDAIEGIERHLDVEPLDAFERNMLVFRAVERELEIISEASRRLPDTLKEKHPEISWRQVADIGNILRHAYQRVEPELLRSIIRNHLPAMKRAVSGMMRELEADDRKEDIP